MPLNATPKSPVPVMNTKSALESESTSSTYESIKDPAGVNEILLKEANPVDVDKCKQIEPLVES